MKVFQLTKVAAMLGMLSIGGSVWGQAPAQMGTGLLPNAYPIPNGANVPPGFTSHPPVHMGWTGPVPQPNQLAGWQDAAIPTEAIPGAIPSPNAIPAPVEQYAPAHAPTPSPEHIQMLGTGAPSMGTNGDCGTTGACSSPSLSCGPVLVAPKPWFFGAGALLFNRIDDCNQRLSFDSTMPTPDALSTDDARIGLMPGFELTAGRYFGCGQYAIAGTYWGLFPDDETASVTMATPNNLRASMPGFQDLDIGGSNAYDWYDGANTHQLTRSSSINNVEVNLIGFGIGCASRAGTAYNNGCNNTCNACVGGPTGMYVPAACSRLSLSWLAGFRWFQFNDDLSFAASNGDAVFDGSDLYYNNNVTNDLFGFQIGGNGNYCITQCISVYSGVKFGVYGNHMQYDTSMGTGTDFAVIDSPNAYDGMPYNYMTSSNDVALIGEWDLGAGYAITPCWSVRAGYRVLAASGIATAVGQIPYDYINVAHLTDIDNCSSLILHGAYIGAQYNF